MGVIAGRAPAPDGLRRLPGNPSPFLHLRAIVRPLLLRLAGAEPEVPLALPVRAASPTRSARVGANMCAWRSSVPRRTSRRSSTRRGAGVLTSLTETDGLVELPEDTTTVEPVRLSGFCMQRSSLGP